MEYVSHLFLGLLLAVILGQMIIPRVMVISLRKRLFDVPDARKVHHIPISRLGGVTFFPVILFVLCILTSYRVMVNHLPNDFFTEKMATEVLCLFAGLTLLYVVGIGDDLVGIRYRSKFKVQILASILFPIAGLYINNFYGLMGIHEVTPYIGIPLTVVLVVFITNAINLIDGIDGLASSICIIALSVFGILFAQSELWLFTQLAFICVGVLIPFFIYNVFGNADRGRKIFMTDWKNRVWNYRDEIDTENCAPGVCRKVLAYTDELMCVENQFKKGNRGGKIYTDEIGLKVTARDLVLPAGNTTIWKR